MQEFHFRAMIFITGINIGDRSGKQKGKRVPTTGIFPCPLEGVMILGRGP